MKRATSYIIRIMISVCLMFLVCAGSSFGISEEGKVVNKSIPRLEQIDRDVKIAANLEIDPGTNITSMHVESEGAVMAKRGSIKLESKKVDTLSFDNDGLIEIAIDETRVNELASEATISDDGFVYVDLKTARSLFHDLVNTDADHVVQAKVVVIEEDGVIALKADFDSEPKALASASDADINIMERQDIAQNVPYTGKSAPIGLDTVLPY